MLPPTPTSSSRNSGVSTNFERHVSTMSTQSGGNTPSKSSSKVAFADSDGTNKSLSLASEKTGKDRLSAMSNSTNTSRFIGRFDNKIYPVADSERRGSLGSHCTVGTTAPGTGSRSPKLSVPPVARRENLAVRCSRCIIHNKSFTALTTLLTVYALIGDDIRLLATNKPADVLFNVFTLVCLFVFSIEIVFSCLGRDDYIFGFFMTLDVVSTATLLMDLTWFTEIVMGDGDLDNMRSGRTARVGAKAGRVVRVIRLVRILKLYKAAYEAASARAKKEMAGKDEDDWDDLVSPTTDHTSGPGQETRVGKKLSEMTTRRVIVLVLTMLMVLPFLRTQSEDNYPPSGSYAADEVYSAWKARVEMPTEPNVVRYEKAMLKYLYYHNWFTQSDPAAAAGTSDPSYYFSHVFWVGLVSTTEEQITSKVNTTGIRLSSAVAWNQKAAMQADIYNFGTMPDSVIPRIGGEWTACNEEDKGVFRRGFSLLGREIDGVVSYAVPCPSDLRNSEKAKFFPRLVSSETYQHWHFAFYFDARRFAQEEAMFGIIITVFICVVLCIASIYFSSDANKLVLQPVEKMIKRVESIRENPLIAMKMADEEFKLELIAVRQKAKLVENPYSMDAIKSYIKKYCRCGTQATVEVMETVVLEKTIIKLGSLLALGFGEAGASIIGHNLACSDSAGVNVMIPGIKVDCIVGRARVNDFSTATEVLQANVMTFVNQIAEIVHGVIDEFQGAANKNDGDKFLIVWLLSGEDDARKMADMSMMAFAKILGAVHRSSVLAAYRYHPGLQQRLTKNCRVNLTFGLHAGWAIEGAVGSEFKIDASYLSPNVSIVSSVELATIVYRVPILISQAVIELASDEMADNCRLIDRVLIKGSVSPMGLYSLDLDYNCLSVEAPRDASFKWNLRERFRARQFLEVEKERRMQLEVQLAVEFNGTKDIVDMRKRYTMDFQQMFHMGFQNYIAGEWEVAKTLLSAARKHLRDIDDGPSRALLHFMEHPHNYHAPDNWKGIREL